MNNSFEVCLPNEVPKIPRTTQALSTMTTVTHSGHLQRLVMITLGLYSPGITVSHTIKDANRTYTEVCRLVVQCNRQMGVDSSNSVNC